MGWTGDVQEEVSPRSLPNIHQDYDNPSHDKSVGFPHLSLKRVDTSRSMLAYSEHMRRLSRSRRDGRDEAKHGDLAIHGQRKKRLVKSDLIGSSRDVGTVSKGNMKSTRSFPNLRSKPPKTLRISFVSASDLREIITYAVANKNACSSKPSVWQKQKVAEIDPYRYQVKSFDYNTTQYTYNDSERHFKGHSRTDLRDAAQEDITTTETALSKLLFTTKVPHSLNPRGEDEKQDTVGRLPGPVVTVSDISRRGDALRHRPRRAKRMILHRPDLGVIDETDSSNQGHTSEADSDTTIQELTELNKDILEKKHHALNTHEKNHSAGEVDQPKQKDPNFSDSDLCIRIQKPICLMNESTKHFDIAHKSATDVKLTKTTPVSKRDRAQKKIRKLTFLREYPKRHYMR